MNPTISQFPGIDVENFRISLQLELFMSRPKDKSFEYIGLYQYRPNQYISTLPELMLQHLEDPNYPLFSSKCQELLKFQPSEPATNDKNRQMPFNVALDEPFYLAKPTTKYCAVCKQKFLDYIKHIYHPIHIKNSNESLGDIKQLISFTKRGSKEFDLSKLFEDTTNDVQTNSNQYIFENHLNKLQPEQNQKLIESEFPNLKRCLAQTTIPNAEQKISKVKLNERIKPIRVIDKKQLHLIPEPKASKSKDTLVTFQTYQMILEKRKSQPEKKPVKKIKKKKKSVEKKLELNYNPSAHLLPMLPQKKQTTLQQFLKLYQKCHKKIKKVQKIDITAAQTQQPKPIVENTAESKREEINRKRRENRKKEAIVKNLKNNNEGSVNSIKNQKVPKNTKSLARKNQTLTSKGQASASSTPRARTVGNPSISSTPKKK